MVLACAVDQGFAEEDAGAEAVGVGEPGGGEVGDGGVEELAGGEEGCFDWVGYDVDLPNVSVDGWSWLARERTQSRYSATSKMFIAVDRISDRLSPEASPRSS